VASRRIPTTFFQKEAFEPELLKSQFFFLKVIANGLLKNEENSNKCQYAKEANFYRSFTDYQISRSYQKQIRIKITNKK
jgi:hypothetical protein